MELRHLRYFVAVAKTLNFRRAAEQLRVAQPALSKQIKDLEGMVGAQLLYRNTGGARLTDTGAVLLEEAREILERAEMAMLAVREAEDGQRGRLSIGNLGAMSAAFLPAALSAFRTRYPKVEVHLEELTLQDQLNALKERRIQIGFGINGGPTIPPDFESKEILVTEMKVVLGRGHRLARRSAIALADLADEQFLCLSPTARHDLHQRRIEAILDARGIKVRPIRRVSSYDSLIALAAGDHGVSIIPTVTHSSNDIIFRPIKETSEDLVVRLSAIWRLEPRSRLAPNFVDILLQQRP